MDTLAAAYQSSSDSDEGDGPPASASSPKHTNSSGTAAFLPSAWKLKQDPQPIVNQQVPISESLTIPDERSAGRLQSNESVNTPLPTETNPDLNGIMLGDRVPPIPSGLPVCAPSTDDLNRELNLQSQNPTPLDPGDPNTSPTNPPISPMASPPTQPQHAPPAQPQPVQQPEATPIHLPDAPKPAPSCMDPPVNRVNVQLDAPSNSTTETQNVTPKMVNSQVVASAVVATHSDTVENTTPVILSPEPSRDPPPIPERAKQFVFGCQVMIIGVKSKPELNHQLGFTVGDFRRDSQRIPVRFMSGSSKAPVYLLKVDNLQFICAPIPGFKVDRYVSESEEEGNEESNDGNESSVSASSDSWTPDAFTTNESGMKPMNLRANNNPIDAQNDTKDREVIDISGDNVQNGENVEKSGVELSAERLQKVNENMKKYRKMVDEFNQPPGEEYPIEDDIQSVNSNWSTKSLPITCGLRWVCPLWFVV